VKYLTSIASVEAYLDNAPGGTVNNPVLLPVKLGAGDWAALLGAINTVKKYVALDLSTSANVGTGTEFDPGSANTGEKYVVSLVLPDAAQSIKVGPRYFNYYDDPLFYYFTNLKEVSGANIKTIGHYAVYLCTSLTSASFPQATSIGEYAFAGCTSLTSVSFPNATTIGGNAFSGCTGLTSASFPEATSIGELAFASCTSLSSVSFPLATSIGVSAFSVCTDLTSVSFPLATSIGIGAFSGCTGLSSANFPVATTIGGGTFITTGGIALTITLGNAPPTVTGYNMFAGVNVPKAVTVRVPSGAISNYDAAWQQAFKDGGGSNISLTVVGY
jgi:hypothetical protein